MSQIDLNFVKTKPRAKIDAGPKWRPEMSKSKPDDPNFVYKSSID